MRQGLEMAFTEGRRLGVPVILETDAKTKCENMSILAWSLLGRAAAFGMCAECAADRKSVV